MKKREPAWRAATIGRHLHNASRRFDARVLELVGASWTGEVKVVHLTLTRCLDYGGTRLTELAHRAAVTKQAMGELIDDCERLGLVARESDPSDGRAKIVCFTDEGFKFMAAFHRAINKVEAEMAAQLGAGAVDKLRQTLAQYGSGADIPMLRERSRAATSRTRSI
jgi:DNA-binding MarR family transcriptional regulator